MGILPGVASAEEAKSDPVIASQVVAAPSFSGIAPSLERLGDHHYDLMITREGGEITLHVRPNGKPRFKFSASDCKLWVLAQGTKLYHWGPKDWIESLAKKGRYTDEDFAKFRAQKYREARVGARVAPDSDLLVEPSRADWGFYMSLDLFDSTQYGSNLIISTLEQDVALVDPKKCLPDIPSHEDLLNLWQEAGGERLKELGIVGTRQSNSEVLPNWLFFVDPRGTSSLREAKPGDFNSDLGMGRATHHLPEWIVVDSKYPIQSDSWLQAHVPVVNKLVRGESINAEDLAWIRQDAAALLNASSDRLGDLRQSVNEIETLQSGLAAALRKTSYFADLKSEIERKMAEKKSDSCSSVFNQVLKP